MGIKSLTLQIIPMCLHVSVQPDPPPSSPGAVRLILCSGRIRLFRRTFPAEELMSSYPHHLVCRSDSLFIGHKVPPLAAGDLLIPGQSYLLFPSAFFSSALSFTSLASSFSSCKLLLLRPFEVRKTDAGKLQLRISDEFVERLGEEEEEEEEAGEGRGSKKEGMVCSTDEMEREYRDLVLRPRLWKPKLETIKELDISKKKKKKKKKKQQQL